jgi:hypothetical protein
MDGFPDRFPKIKIVASRAGGHLPYVSKRMDLFFEQTGFDKKFVKLPSTCFEQIYYD